MSDCRHGGRDVYKPNPTPDQATIRRMCRQFGNPPWTLPYEKPECWPDEAVQLVEAIDFCGVRFERVRECEFKPFRGPISDTDEEGDRKGVCSECSAYMHEQFNYCPNCGSRVKGNGE